MAEDYDLAVLKSLSMVRASFQFLNMITSILEKYFSEFLSSQFLSTAGCPYMHGQPSVMRMTL